MYTHLYINEEDARTLYETSSSRPEKEMPFVAYFKDCKMFYVPELDATLERDYPRGLWVLKFGHYLTEAPKYLDSRGATVLMVEYVRFQSAPTRAIAGYYADPKNGMTAMVERIFPNQQQGKLKTVPLYAQNIRVSAPSFELARKANANVSQGYYGRFLVDRME